ncbi:MAG: amidohydrolase [Thermoplasmataceae archaeon]
MGLGNGQLVEDDRKMRKINRADISMKAASILPELERLYRDIHSHPELSFQETRTASLVSDLIDKFGFRTRTGIGGTGVVGIMQNGKGPCVMLRADMDALPVKEDTGLPYASMVTSKEESGTDVPVMHACGHDMHVAWLLGASQIMANIQDEWNGTLMVLFQPAEETGKGAAAMIRDGLARDFPRPDVILGQHVMVGEAGTIGWCTGPATSISDSLKVKLFGRGSHGSMPQASIDPVVMAASVVLRLQTIVSREVPPSDFSVVTVGSIQAGQKDNVIPDEATILLNVRSMDINTRDRVLAAITRIVNAEAQASGAIRQPEITQFEHYPMVQNDPAATMKVVDSFKSFFGSDHLVQVKPTSASEDFGIFGNEWHSPSVFWFVGGTDPNVYKEAVNKGLINEIPANHNPRFAPVIHPTLETGVQSLIAAAMPWLSQASGE